MMRVYGYGRASTDKQEASPLQQQAQAESYFKALQSTTFKDCEWGGWVCDIAISGSSDFLKRPQVMPMMAALRRGDHIITCKLDRAFRSINDALHSTEVLGGLGITTHILDLPGVDLSTPHGRLMFNISSSVAQFEREILAQRTKDALQFRRSLCVPCTNPPVGYRIEGKGSDGKFVIDMETRRIAATLFQMCNRGVTQRQAVSYFTKHEDPAFRPYRGLGTVGRHYRAMKGGWKVNGTPGLPTKYDKIHGNMDHEWRDTPFFSLNDYRALQAKGGLL